MLTKEYVREDYGQGTLMQSVYSSLSPAQCNWTWKYQAHRSGFPMPGCLLFQSVPAFCVLNCSFIIACCMFSLSHLGTIRMEKFQKSLSISSWLYLREGSMKFEGSYFFRGFYMLKFESIHLLLKGTSLGFSRVSGGPTWYWYINNALPDITDFLQGYFILFRLIDCLHNLLCHAG